MKKEVVPDKEAVKEVQTQREIPDIRPDYIIQLKLVTITPEVISKPKSREILKMLSKLYQQSHLGNMLLAYDGTKSAFAAGPLPFESKEFVVNLTEANGREKEFKVNIKFVARKDLDYLKQFLNRRQHDSPQETIQALDVVLREASSKENRQIVGRSLFSTEFGKGVLGDGIEYWKGFYQRLRPTQQGLSLNIDMSARAFYEPKLVTAFVSDFLQKDLMRPLSDQERIKVKRALRGVRVEWSLTLLTDIERWQKGVASTHVFGSPIEVTVQRQEPSKPVPFLLIKCAVTGMMKV
ncbi:hypothetical protein LXL04_038032 [Taraxacum kok-saghyz]